MKHGKGRRASQGLREASLSQQEEIKGKVQTKDNRVSARSQHCYANRRGGCFQCCHRLTVPPRAEPSPVRGAPCCVTSPRAGRAAGRSLGLLRD